MAPAVRVHGLRELNATFRDAPKDTRRALHDEYRTIAEPVKTTAEALAVSEIPRVGVPWSRMRVGITTRLVYVAPRPRGGRGSRRRPNFATLLARRALEPALARNAHRIEADFDAMLGRLVDKWDKEGP